MSIRPSSEIVADVAARDELLLQTVAHPVPGDVGLELVVVLDAALHVPPLWGRHVHRKVQREDLDAALAEVLHGRTTSPESDLSRTRSKSPQRAGDEGCPKHHGERAYGRRVAGIGRRAR